MFHHMKKSGQRKLWYGANAGGHAHLVLKSTQSIHHLQPQQQEHQQAQSMKRPPVSYLLLRNAQASLHYNITQSFHLKISSTTCTDDDNNHEI